MNTKTRGLIYAAVFAVATATLSAGSLDYLSNQSAGYFFSTAQTASTAGAGIVPYNPAGTALLDKGFYLDASNQTILKYYDESVDSTYLSDSYSQKDPTPFLPSLALVYNFGNVGPGKLALYGNGGITAGGGNLKWDDGTIGTNSYGLLVAQAANALSPTTPTVPNGSSTKLTASSIYYGLGTGVSYAFLDDKVSASAGVRYVNAQRSGSISGTMNLVTYTPAATPWSLSVDYDYTYSAQGLTPIFGLNVRPVSGLTLGARYEMETKLEFEYSDDTPTVTCAANPTVAALVKSKLNWAGKKVRQDLPQVLGFGAEYMFTPKFTLSAGTNLYFMNAATIEDVEGDDISDLFGIGYELNLAGQYQFTEKLLAGLTAMYSNQGAKDSYYEDDTNLLFASANPPLDSLTVGGGVKYNVIKTLDLLLTTSYVHYFPKSATTDAGLEIDYSKTVYNFGLGASYKF
jgi:long-chain fatty acid transport protein